MDTSWELASAYHFALYQNFNLRDFYFLNLNFTRSSSMWKDRRQEKHFALSFLYSY